MEFDIKNNEDEVMTNNRLMLMSILDIDLNVRTLKMNPRETMTIQRFSYSWPSTEGIKFKLITEQE